MALLAVGYALLMAPHISAGIVGVIASAIAIGVGMGLANLTTLVAAQTGVSAHRIGVATSTIMLFRTFGGAFAVSLMGTVMLNRMQGGLGRLQSGNTAIADDLWQKLANPQNLLEPATRSQVPADLLPHLIALLGDAIWYGFVTAFILMILGLIVSFFIPPYTPANTPKPAR
jgi:hypothetical protein